MEEVSPLIMHWAASVRESKSRRRSNVSRRRNRLWGVGLEVDAGLGVGVLNKQGFVIAGGIFVHKYKHKLLRPMSRSTVVASAFLMIGAPRVLMGQSEAPDQLEEITITAEKI